MSNEITVVASIKAAKWGWDVKRGLKVFRDLIGSNHLSKIQIIGPNAWEALPIDTDCPHGGYMLLKNCGPFDTGVLNYTAGEDPLIYEKYIVLATRQHDDPTKYQPFLWLYDGDIALLRTVPQFPNYTGSKWGYYNNQIYARTYVHLAFASDDCTFTNGVAPIPDTIAAAAVNFETLGFEMGQEITVADSTLNDGNYTISAITAGTIFIADGIVNEGAVAVEINTPVNLGGWRNLEMVRLDP